jgi:hypothetical protein
MIIEMTTKTLSRRDNMLVENETMTKTSSRRDGMWARGKNRLYCLNQDYRIYRMNNHSNHINHNSDKRGRMGEGTKGRKGERYKQRAFPRGLPACYLLFVAL